MELIHRLSVDLVTKDVASDWHLLIGITNLVIAEARLHGCPEGTLTHMASRPDPDHAQHTILTISIEWKVDR